MDRAKHASNSFRGETAQWPNGESSVKNKFFDQMYEGGIFEPLDIVASIQTPRGEHQSVITSQMVFWSLTKHACIKNVEIRHQERDKRIVYITLYSGEMKYMFRDGMVFGIEGQGSFRLHFDLTSPYGSEHDPFHAAFAKNLWPSTNILTHKCQAFLKAEAEARRPIRRGLVRYVTKAHLMEVVEIYHPRFPDNSVSINATIIDDSAINQRARWIPLTGYLLPEPDAKTPSGPTHKFLIEFHRHMICITGLMECVVRPYAYRGVIRATWKTPVQFRIPTWALIGSPSLSWPFNRIRSGAENLFLSLHCNRAVDIYRFASPEDIQRENDDAFVEVANSKLFIQTFLHDFDLSTDTTRPDEWPVEKALGSCCLSSNGFVLPIEIWGDQSDEAYIRHWQRMLKFLSSLSYFRWPVRSIHTKKSSKGPGGVVSPVVTRLVLPIPNTAKLCDAYFLELQSRRNNYLCYGAMAMLVQNGWYPKRWIASFMGMLHSGQDTAIMSARSEVIAIDALHTSRVADNVLFDALKTLCSQCATVGRIIDIELSYKQARSAASQRNMPLPDYLATESLVTLFHTYITPTHAFALGPNTEPSNRVLRKYGDIQHRFMRASFIGNNHQKLFLTFPENTLLLSKMRLTLLTGYRFGARVFTFLAYGNSQLKQSSFWSYCEKMEGVNEIATNVTRQAILNGLGNFDDPFIGKRAARMGQCFSSTKHATDIAMDKRSSAPDIEVNIIRNDPSKGKFCFTDGVGTFGTLIGRRIAFSLHMDDIPSAVQVRFRGAKGMLVHHPGGPRDQILLRKSQTKFLANQSELEVCEWSRPLSLQLNKQLILLLQTLGVPDAAFLKILDEETMMLNHILSSKESAIEFLMSERLSTLTDIVPLLLWMIRTGFDIYATPLIKHTLRHLRRWLWRHDYQKFRLPVRLGVCAYGVNDISRQLKYDCGCGCPEIFLQVSPRRLADCRMGPRILISPNDVDTGCEYDEDVEISGGDINYASELSMGRVIEGFVLVSKSPSQDPGDIIICKAVRCNALRHLVDCIVFPGPGEIKHSRHPGNGQHPRYANLNMQFDGCRDIPNMLSGGDLDGDIYQIIWDPDFVEPVLKRFLASELCPNPPAHYTIPFKNMPKSDKIVQPSISVDNNHGRVSATRMYSEWFVQWHRYDNLGQVCNMWLRRMMDPEVYNGPKAFDKLCLDLAERASLSVDFAKSGITARTPVIRELLPKPYFLIDDLNNALDIGHRSALNFHCRSSILGKLWDRIEEFRRPYVSDSLCILTKEGWYWLNEKQMAQRTHSDAEILVGRSYDLGYTSPQIEDLEQRETEEMNLESLLQHGDGLQTYYYVGSSNPTTYIPLTQEKLRFRSSRGVTRREILANVKLLCRLDFQSFPSDDKPHISLELFITKAYPVDGSSTSLTLFNGCLTNYENLVPDDMFNPDDIAPTSLIHNPIRGTTCIVLGIAPLQRKKGREYLMNSFHIVVRVITSETSKIIGVTNEIEVFNTTDEELQCYMARPNLHHLRTMTRDLPQFSEFIERYKVSVAPNKTMRNKHTSVNRSAVLLYKLLKETSKAHQFALPEFLRVHTSEQGATITETLPFADYINPYLMLEYQEFVSTWEEYFAIVLDESTFYSLSHLSDFFAYFVVLDAEERIIYSPVCQKSWVASETQVLPHLPSNGSYTHLKVLLWNRPIYKGCGNPPSLPLVALSKTTLSDFSIAESLQVLKSFFKQLKPIPDLVSPVEEWLTLKKYEKLLFARCPAITPQMKRCIKVMLWLPTDRRVETVKQLDKFDMREHEITPLGCADHYMRRNMKVNMRYVDIYQMAHGLNEIPHARMRDLNPQCRTDCVANEVNLKVDRRLLHPDLGEHMLFATQISEVYQAHLRTIMTDLQLVPHLHEIAAITGCIYGDNNGERQVKLQAAFKQLQTQLQYHLYDRQLRFDNQSGAPQIERGINDCKYEARASAMYLVCALNLRAQNSNPWHPLLFCHIDPAACQKSNVPYDELYKLVKQQLTAFQTDFMRHHKLSVAMCSTPFILYGQKLVSQMIRVQQHFQRQRSFAKCLSAFWRRFEALRSISVHYELTDNDRCVKFTLKPTAEIALTLSQSTSQSLNGCVTLYALVRARRSVSVLRPDQQHFSKDDGGVLTSIVEENSKCSCNGSVNHILTVSGLRNLDPRINGDDNVTVQVHNVEEAAKIPCFCMDPVVAAKHLDQASMNRWLAAFAFELQTLNHPESIDGWNSVTPVANSNLNLSEEVETTDKMLENDAAIEALLQQLS